MTDLGSDFDVEKYKTDYECEDHWKLRKSFMEAHKDKFEEDELVCLAQVFTNIEFMGCKYPSETMQMVNELAKDVIGEYRKSRENRLKRTFIGGAEAASNKVKRK